MAKLAELLAVIADQTDTRIPALARTCLAVLAQQLQELQLAIGEIDRELHAWHRSNATSRRLETIPGIGPITASALAVTTTDPKLFRSGRHLAAWLGLVPEQNSSGGKARLGGISKQRDRYIRRLLISGAHAVLRGRVMIIGRVEGRENPVGVSRSTHAGLFGTRPPDLIKPSGHANRANRPDT
jgi:transposase